MIELTREGINTLLMTNDRAVERALTVLYAKQTASERDAKATRENNSVGFSAIDAEIFSSFAQWVERGRSLTAGQLSVCRKVRKNGFCKLNKYWKQLVAAAEEKSGRQANLV